MSSLTTDVEIVNLEDLPIEKIQALLLRVVLIVIIIIVHLIDLVVFLTASRWTFLLSISPWSGLVYVYHLVKRHLF